MVLVPLLTNVLVPLVNPGFEGPTGWGKYREGARSVVYKIVPSGRHGSCALIEVGEEADLDWYNWFQFVPAKPWTFYLLRGFVKTEKVRERSGAFIALDAYDKNGKRVGIGIPQWVAGTRDWLRTESWIETPPKTASLRVMCLLYGRGKAWFDDLVLYELRPPGPAEEKSLWQRCKKKGVFVFRADRLPAPGEELLFLGPETVYTEERGYGWLPGPKGNVEIGRNPRGISLFMHPDRKASALFRADVGPGRWFLHLFEAKFGPKVDILSGRAVGSYGPVRVYELRANRDGALIVNFEAPRSPPVQRRWATAPVKFLALCRSREERPLLPFVKESERILDLRANLVRARLRALPPTLIPVKADRLSPGIIRRLEAQKKKGSEEIICQGEVLRQGLLVVTRPGGRFSVSVCPPKGAPLSVEVLCGVPGWMRVGHKHSCDFWHSPAQWLEHKNWGKANLDGLGLVWLRIRAERAGVYKIRIFLKTSEAKMLFPLTIKVLPLSLPEPGLDLGMFYNAVPHWLDLRELGEVWRAQLSDMKRHGLTLVFLYTASMARPLKGGKWDLSLARSFVEEYLRFFRRPIYWNTHHDRWPDFASYVREISSLCRNLSLDVFFMPVDESDAFEERLKDAVRWFRIVKAQGERTAATLTGIIRGGDELLDPWVDVHLYGAGCVSRKVIKHTARSGDVFMIYNGGSGGAFPLPERDRFFFGLYVWATKAKGAFQWAYQWPGGDDMLDGRAGQHWCYSWPVEAENRAACSVQLEAVAEGITDLRYLLWAEGLAKKGEEMARKAEKILSRASREVGVFLDRLQKGDSVRNYEALVRLYPPERLDEIRRSIKELMIYALKTKKQRLIGARS